jgi:hypothetical protein
MVARSGVTRIIASTSAMCACIPQPFLLFPPKSLPSVFRYSSSADTTVRKWLPIAADGSRGLASFQFPGDAVEVARLPPGRTSAGRGAQAVLAGAAAVKVVGVADSVEPVAVEKPSVHEGTAEAHDNSLGGVQVICKHEDKVLVVEMVVVVTVVVMLVIVVIIIVIVLAATVLVVAAAPDVCRPGPLLEGLERPCTVSQQVCTPAYCAVLHHL